jgi:trans-aconitate methyltransferase
MGAHSNETAELYAGVWQRGLYSGFSRNTRGESSTPFLDAFVHEVSELITDVPRVVELGAGSCHHALRLALAGLHTTAVEYSDVAVAAARQCARRFADVELEIVQADLFAFTAQLPESHLAGVYANAVFHFLSPDQRRNQYRVLRQALVVGGVLGISFKAEGDALQRRGSVVEETAAGPVVRGDDGICRLFVTCTDALKREMHEQGYTVKREIRWSVSDYNVPDESSEFVGLLATR